MNISLSTLSNAQGYRILGENNGDRSGNSVSDAGDINGDGYGDIIIGAPYATGLTGKNYVLFGKSSGFSDISLSTLTSSQGFRIFGENAYDESGFFVRSAGDINGDGYDEVIIGAPFATTGAGKSYVLFGKASGFSDINLSALTSSQGFKILGESTYDYSGISTSNAGDINNDGYNDIIVGAPSYGTGNTGKSYVLFGKASGFSDISLSMLTSAQGFRILGENVNDQSGRSVSNAGDINNDGYEDVIIGASGATTNAGKSYVIFGKASGFSNINLSTLTTAQGFKILGENNGDWTGHTASTAGDINGDGYLDIIIGADKATNQAGKSYVLFGKSTGFSDINLSTLTPTQGFRILGESSTDRSGISVSNTGDINHDGYTDIIIGASQYATSNTGKSYVIFGKATGFSDIDLSTLTSVQGFKILGENSADASGCSVSGAGDINGDGYSDVIIGAYGASSFSGKSYVLFAMLPLQVTADNITAIYKPNTPTNIPLLTISYSGFVNSEDPSDLTVQPKATTTATSVSIPGIYPITVSGGVSSHYYFDYIDGYLTIKEDNGSSDFNLLNNFLTIGIPILSGVAALISIIYTLNKCKNEGMCCFRRTPAITTALLLNSQSSQADAAQVDTTPEDNIVYYDQAKEDFSNNEIPQAIDY